MPIPWRHGGREGVPTCIACHDLKDRAMLNDWTREQSAAMEAGVGVTACLIGGLWENAWRDPFSEPFDLRVTRDAALKAIQECTTAEARIFAARTVCFVLDFDKEYRDMGCADGASLWPRNVGPADSTERTP